MPSDSLNPTPAAVPLALHSLSPGADLDSYLRTISALPILSREEEKALAIRLRLHNDLDAARRLVICHLRFVAHLARTYQGYGLPQADLIQEGNVGLMRAVKRFDPQVGVRLMSFAAHWIKAEMREYILRNWRIVRVATSKAQRKLFFNLRGAKKQATWLSADEAKAVAAELNVSEDEVARMESRLAGADVAFDGLDADDDEDAKAPAHFLTSSSADPADEAGEDIQRTFVRAKLAEAMDQLDDRSRDIIDSRWLRGDKSTLASLSEQYGVSKERIRQLETAALKKIRANFDQNGILAQMVL